MKQKASVVLVFVLLLVFALAAPAFLQGCAYPGSSSIKVTPPPKSKPVWTEASEIVNPRHPSLSQEGGDIVLEKLGDALGFYAIPDEDRQVLTLDWDKEILGFYVLDLHTRAVLNLGGVRIKGPQPKVESCVWPWVLLRGEDEEGNNSWTLVNLSRDKAEIAWEFSAWVPQGLRKGPVWFSGETWYLGPVSGPTVTDALSGETIKGKPQYDILNPVSATWPRWAGGVSLSNWYMYPVQDGGSVIMDLATGIERKFTQDQDLTWNLQRTQLAWTQDGELGVLDPRGMATTLVSNGFVPGAPLWSGNGENLYFLGGEENYFGTTWKSLWSWNQDSGASHLFALPGSWNQWRLRAATDEAVLAAAGEGGEHLVYFDVANAETTELSAVRQWLWQDGTLIVLAETDLVRLSPGFETKILAREAEDYHLLGIVHQFVLYSSGDKIYIKQLVM